MTKSVHLTTRCRSKNNSIRLKKMVLIINTQQRFIGISTKRIALLKESLQLVREEAGAQITSRNKKCSRSHGSNC